MDTAIEYLSTTLPHILLILCLVGGLVGSLIPGVPGASLIFIAALIHGGWTQWDPLGLYTQITLGALAVSSFGVQFAVTAMGAKKYGASKWGILGATLGIFAGLFIPIPVLGPLIGAFVGATLAESAASGRIEIEAAKAGSGAVMGAVLGLMAELGIALMMIGVIIFSSTFW
jgi:hypothetical protein